MYSNLGNKRSDIQALRGIAILMVVLYHLKIEQVPAGYLGVDVFFVISGYLLSNIVTDKISRNEFSYFDYILRRAKRLIPASIATLSIVIILSPWILNQQELRGLPSQVIGAITYSSNIILWQQSGYFEADSQLKPLLNYWSLAIEGQFIVLLPLVFLIAKVQHWMRIISFTMFLSLCYYIAASESNSDSTFYLISSRIWELLIGVIGALLQKNTVKPQVLTKNKIIVSALLITIAGLSLISNRMLDHRISALFICIATILIILANNYEIQNTSITKFLAKIGDASYSTYLIHWPIIAFHNNAWIGNTSENNALIKLILFIIIFDASIILYYFIEKPFQLKPNLEKSKFFFSACTVVSVAIMTATPLFLLNDNKTNFAELRKFNHGLSENCNYQGQFVPKLECKTSAEPTLLVWGDSFAKHLIPGLVNEWKDGGLIQATSAGCAPFLGIAPYHLSKPTEGPYINRKWAQECITFNQSVIDWLKEANYVKVVVLSSAISHYLNPDNFEHISMVGNNYESNLVDISAVRTSLINTIKKIEKLEKKVILVAPPPRANFNVGRCLERQLDKKFSFGWQSDCNINRPQYESLRSDTIGFLQSVELVSNISVIHFEPWLCNSTICFTMLNNVLIYRDEGHLSIKGSELIANRMQLGRQIKLLTQITQPTNSINKQ